MSGLVFLDTFSAKWCHLRLVEVEEIVDCRLLDVVDCGGGAIEVWVDVVSVIDEVVMVSVVL